jgi:hypothetical protein
MEDWWGFDTAGHALKTNISDVFGVSQVYGAGKAIKQGYIPYDDPRGSPGMKGLEYPSPYATTGRKKRLYWPCL